MYRVKPDMAITLLSNMITNLATSFKVANKIEAHEIPEFVGLILQDIRLPSLKPSELKIFEKQAKCGTFGQDYNRFDGVTLMRWLNEYFDKRCEIAEMVKPAPVVTEVAKQLEFDSESAKIERRNKKCLELYNFYKTRKTEYKVLKDVVHFADVLEAQIQSPIVYDHLVKYNFMIIDNERKNRIFKDAEEVVVRIFKHLKKQTVKEIEAEEKRNDFPRPELKIRAEAMFLRHQKEVAKCLALQEWFKYLTEEKLYELLTKIK